MFVQPFPLKKSYLFFQRKGAVVQRRNKIIDSYVYRTGILQSSYSYSTAVGTFKALVSLTFILGGNLIIKRMGYRDSALF